jgi:hypothetical protein
MGARRKLSRFVDINKGGLLKLIKGNILRNAHLSKHPINVLELDFTWQVLPREIVAVLEKTPVVIAADGESFLPLTAHEYD